MRHHRTDEYGSPTDRSHLRGGYEAPGLSPRLVRTVLLLLSLVVAALYFS